ncbi:hypothetical protein WICPIJ_010009 [Wickerhamomyces pijperi]|uniref:Uncharacterized protein n=1 Tax=Wickerhamomyces pijperi TaxID=599730 RepID=A0A9P8PJV7_WICPI|nr:hypothetical protein WICPIJ_010009 [Wickerhamomyces pijperi]
MVFTLESYSAGNVSKTKYESLLTPTKSFGLKVSGSTKPTNGKNTVCLVDVLMTADLPALVAFKSMLPPCFLASSSASISNNSTILPTK